MKQMLTNRDFEGTIPVINPAKITRDVKRRRVINKEEIKKYGIVYTKRVIQQDFSTLPYGF